MRKLAIGYVLLACTATAVQACGGEGVEAAAVHVDIAQVAETGEIEPVGGLSSAGQPDVRALQAVAEAGYAAVIDLRGPDEERGLDEAAATEALGLDYVNLPIVGREAISFDKARELDAILAGYDEPVLVHCGSGNRVGALLALRDSLAGAEDEAALDYGRRAGLTRLEPVVKERLEADEAK